MWQNRELHHFVVDVGDGGGADAPGGHAPRRVLDKLKAMEVFF